MSLKDRKTIPRNNHKSMDESEDDDSLTGELGDMAVDSDAPTSQPTRPQLGKDPLLHLASKYVDKDHYIYGYEDNLEENIIGENIIKAYMADHQGQGPFLRKSDEVAQLDICTFQNLYKTAQDLCRICTPSTSHG